MYVCKQVCHHEYSFVCLTYYLNIILRAYRKIVNIYYHILKTKKCTHRESRYKYKTTILHIIIYMCTV